MDVHTLFLISVAVVLTAIAFSLATSNIKTTVEIRENELIFRSSFSTKKYRILEVLENDAPVSSVIKYRISGINLPSKKIGKFRTKYGTAKVYCTTPYCTVLKTDRGIVVVDSVLLEGGE
ncbi:hypothetical protein [Thermococcus sp.]|uniref:hypothetical protein n=1 Tax=Thermococcus sp. TaxID=35749 RepID=UPI002638BCAE|nr:hypothetical protein [Thermococcus sp.]